MDTSYHSPAQLPSPVSPATRRSKVILQRQYRANEGEHFNALREVINELTGEELHTRHDILRKAIELLSTALRIRKSREVMNIRSTSYYETHPMAENPELVQIGSTLESSSWPPRWHSSEWSSGGSRSSYHVSQLDDQLDQHMFNGDSMLNSAGHTGYLETQFDQYPF